MKPIVVIKFNVNITLRGGLSSSIAESIDRIEKSYQDRLHDYHILAIPEMPEEVSFFDIQVLNAEHIKEVDFEQFKSDIKNQLMKQFNP